MTDSDWGQLQVLAEPTRRLVFETVRSARAPMTRDEVAEELGLQRPLAAFHLDRLAEVGLLTVTYARPPGRTGRGAGRPAKRYDARDVSVTVSLPPERHALIGRLLAQAIAERPADAASHAAEIAYEEGQRLGATRRRSGRQSAETAMRVAADALTELGYEPECGQSGVRLLNCPFHDVVDTAPQLVCSLNERLIGGVLTGLGASEKVATELDPAPGRCCVVLHKRRRPTSR